LHTLAQPTGGTTANRRIVLSGALLAMMLAALDSSIVNTALPRMVADLGGLAHLSWVVTAFMLCSTITTPLYGKLSDSYGRRAMFGVSIAIFLLGSVLCGAARTMDALIAFRAVQGLGAGGLLVLAQAMIGDVVSPRERPRYQGLFTATFGLASVAGPLLGGIITQLLSWRWIFYVNLPIGILAIIMIRLGLRHLATAQPSGQARRIDYPGAALLTGLTTSLLLLLAWGGNEFPWLSADSLALSLLTLAFLLLFTWREAHAAEPIIRLALFKNHVFARGSLVGGMVMFAMLGALVFLPLYFQLVFGMSPTASGAMILPQVACMLFSSILGGRIVSRYGHYQPFLLAGIGFQTLALATLGFLAIYSAPPLFFLIVLGLLGLGIGMAMPNLTNAIQNAVAYNELGAATGAMVFIRSLGGALGVAASGAILSARLAAARATGHFPALNAHSIRALASLPDAQRTAIAQAYRTALSGSFLLCGAVMIAAFLLVLSLPEIKLRNEIK
jgi:EmrB/QacA subfamily drug resistance transporter